MRPPSQTYGVLGEIRSHLVRSRKTPQGELRLVPEPGRRAIRVDDRGGETVGYLPRSVAAYLAPLIDSQLVQGTCRADVTAPKPKVILTIRALGRPPHLLAPIRIRTEEDAHHEVVRRVFEAARERRSPEAISGLVGSLRHLKRKNLLPQTCLLLALLEGMAGKKRDQRLHDSLATLTIGEPIQYRSLTLLPLAWPEAAEPEYLLIDEAIDAGEAFVEEVDANGQVPNLRLVNRGVRPVLVPEGSILVGAKQNRVVNLTILAPAKEILLLPVSCVEAGRWRMTSPHFAATHAAPASLRSKKLVGVQRNRETSGRPESDQGEVWSEIDSSLAACAAPSPTRSLTDGYTSVQDDFDDYCAHLKLPKGTCGLIWARSQKILALDLFDWPGAFALCWERLLRAHVFDAVRFRKPPSTDNEEVFAEPYDLDSTPDRAVATGEARRFLDEIAAASTFQPPPTGLGEEVVVEGKGIVGTGLWYEGRLCHLAAFASP